MRLLKWVGILLVAFIVMGVVGNALGGGSDTDTAVPKPSASTPESEPEATEEVEADDPDDTEDADEEDADYGPLWKKADGKREFTCSDRGAFVAFELPATSPITKELNSLLKAADGRKPVTVLTLNVYEPDFVEEGGAVFRELVLKTPKGTVEVGPGSYNDVETVLWGSGLTDENSNVGTKKLRDRAAALDERVAEDNDTGTFYFVLEQPLTQVDDATASFTADSESYCWRDE